MRLSNMITRVSRDIVLNRNFIGKLQNLPWKRSYVTSREMIKPSSPTYRHNKSIYLSLVDQLTPPIYTSILLFYQNDSLSNNTIQQKTDFLKKSLSDTLVDFYPLAGRIKGNELIECNDEGVEFCVAHPSSGNIVDFIENPSVHDLRVLLPFQNEPEYKNIVMSIQLNHFSCGGIAIGMCLSHKIADACAIVDFIKYWATKAKNNGQFLPVPKFNGSSIFPPSKEFNETNFTPNVVEEGIAIRRLIFDKESINKIKGKSTAIKAITAFIWNQFPKISGVLHFVDIRKRMVPSISEESFGNIAFFTKTSPTAKVGNFQFKTEEIHKAITKFNNDYIQDLFFSDDFMLKLNKECYELYGNSQNCLYFSSVRALPIYDVDFGMGKPIWVCLPSTIGKNFVLLMSTKCGQGIEAWISMHEDDIATLDNSLSQLGYPLVKVVNLK